MDVRTFSKITNDAWNQAGGEAAIRNGLKRLGYHSHDYLFPMAKVMEVAEGTDDERASFAVDMELIRDYVLNNGGK